jgi:hypothetical protein
MANHQNAGNAGLYNAAGGLNGMPSAGHYSDMQTLMQNMETLSGWLQQNREDFLSVQDGLEQVERHNVGHSLEELNTRLASRAAVGEQDSDTVHRLDTSLPSLPAINGGNSEQRMSPMFTVLSPCRLRHLLYRETSLVTSISQRPWTPRHLP